MCRRCAGSEAIHPGGNQLKALCLSRSVASVSVARIFTALCLTVADCLSVAVWNCGAKCWSLLSMGGDVALRAPLAAQVTVKRPTTGEKFRFPARKWFGHGDSGMGVRGPTCGTFWRQLCPVPI